MNRMYKGVCIYGKRGNYTCDIFTFPDDYPFKTLKDIKEYIDDWIETEKGYEK